jgi:hypothetical protein
MNFVIESKSKIRQNMLNTFGQKYAEFLNIDKKPGTVYICLRRDVDSEHQSEGLTLGFDKDFFIYLQSSLNACDLLRTLAHEMVHVKQLVRGQLKHKATRGKVDTYWCGRKNNKSYLSQPWEVEAFSKEILLFRRAVQNLIKD